MPTELSAAVKLPGNPQLAENLKWARLGVEHRDNDVAGMSVARFDQHWPTSQDPRRPQTMAEGWDSPIRGTVAARRDFGRGRNARARHAIVAAVGGVRGVSGEGRGNGSGSEP